MKILLERRTFTPRIGPFGVLILFFWMHLLFVCLFVFFCSVNASFVDFKLNDFVTLMQRYMQQHNEVELSALGMGTSP